jgi:hypothetical protein
MAKGNAGKAVPAKAMSGQNRPNGKAYKKFIKQWDAEKGKMVRIPNPKA